MDNLGNVSHPRLALPSETAALEAFIPGYPFIYRLLVSYFHVDPSTYVPYILTTGLIAASLRYIFYWIIGLLRQYFVSTTEIPISDEIYSYVMFWIARQSFSGKSKRLVAGIRVSGGWGDEEDGSDDEDSREDESSYLMEEMFHTKNESSGDASGDGKLRFLADFDDYWARILSRDKHRPIHYTPAPGAHYFRFRGRLILFSRVSEDRGYYNGRYSGRSERLCLSCLGRDPTILKELLREAQRTYVERDSSRTVIYHGRKQGHSGYYWARCMARAPRPLSTVVLNEEQKQAFISDLKEYLHPHTRRWYSNRGIPYRRGYLFHGPPGTGKTSLCSAAAGLFGLKLYLLNLNSGSLDEDSFTDLFRELPQRCIVLLEDVDSAGMTQKRSGLCASSLAPAAEPSRAEDPRPEESETTRKGISLSAVLNVIDGVAATEGRILVMTTNHVEKLDGALLRPGRVDMSIKFGYADKSNVRKLFSGIYTALEGDLPLSQPANTNGPVDIEVVAEDTKSERKPIPLLAEEFASRVPSGEFTPAEIQGYLLTHKNQPEKAFEAVDIWIKELRRRKMSCGDIR